MTPSSYFRELAYPLTDASVLLSMLALFAVAEAVLLVVLVLLRVALPLGVMAGAFAAIVILPVTARYLMQVLDARISGTPPRPLSLGSADRLGATWALGPIVLLAASAWAVAAAGEIAGGVAAVLAALALTACLPAVLAVLALTGSPFAALNPMLLAGLARACGGAYWLVPFTVLSSAAVVFAVFELGAPRLLADFLLVLALFLFFTLLGAVVGDSAAVELVDIASPAPPDPKAATAARERRLAAVASHAYGLFSRDNSEGGLKHIEDFIGKFENFTDQNEAYSWFFRHLLEWEQRRPALLLGQYYLHFLVAAGEGPLALKTLSRCLREAEDFRPLPEDRQPLYEQALAARHDELAARLR